MDAERARNAPRPHFGNMERGLLQKKIFSFSETPVAACTNRRSPAKGFWYSLTDYHLKFVIVGDIGNT